MSNEYILVERTSRPGKNGVTYWRFTFYCLKDGLFYETTVDNTYGNYRKCGWEEITQDESPWGRYTGLTRTQRVTKGGLPVITADSRPRLQQRSHNQNEAILDVVADRERRDPDQFLKFFGDQ